MKNSTRPRSTRYDSDDRPRLSRYLRLNLSLRIERAPDIHEGRACECFNTPFSILYIIQHSVCILNSINFAHASLSPYSQNLKPSINILIECCLKFKLKIKRATESSCLILYFSIVSPDKEAKIQDEKYRNYVIAEKSQPFKIPAVMDRSCCLRCSLRLSGIRTGMGVRAVRYALGSVSYATRQVQTVTSATADKDPV